MSSYLDPGDAPCSTRAMVVSVTNAVNHPIMLTKPSGAYPPCLSSRRKIILTGMDTYYIVTPNNCPEGSPMWQVLLAWLGMSVLVVVLTSCETDADRTRSSNEAANSKMVFDPDERSGRIRVFDLREGDCFIAPDVPLLSTGNLEVVELVQCTAKWKYRVLNTFALSIDGPYPSDQYFINQADERCHRLYDVSLSPTFDSWAAGDRVVSCIQESI